MTEREIDTKKYIICCPMCDNKECVRGTEKCEAEIWAKEKRISEKEGDRLYIKIYADMEPGDIAEKVYCICNEEKLPEVVDILSEIVRDNCEDNK